MNYARSPLAINLAILRSFLFRKSLQKNNTIIYNFVKFFFNTFPKKERTKNCQFIANGDLALDQKFQQQGKVSAIDVDIFANRLTDNQFLEELSDIVHKLRMTEETTNSLESMGHALIRLYLNCNNINELMDILNDRLSYGIFLDSYIANLAMDQFIKAKDYKSAARISTFMMLQENFDNQITICMSLFGCIKFLEAPESFELIPDTIVASTNTAPTKPADKKKIEEVKVRVGFLRNPFFDDHFDLVDSQLLVGKTLVMIGNCIIDNTLGASTKLLGLCLYRKYDAALEFLDSNKKLFYKDAVKMVSNILSLHENNNNENYTKLVGLITNLKSNELIEDSFEKTICKFTNDAVSKFEKNDIEQQITTYNEWMQLRDKKLAEELDRINRARRLADIEKLRKEMEKEEEKLWFFENEDKIDLQIDSKRIYYPKRWFGKKKKPRVVDAGYVPPEIRSTQAQK